MYRAIYEDLLEWKGSPKRKPLLLRGVRQCGKTYILKKFGKENYSRTAYFNFEESPDLSSIFKPDLDPHRILEDLRIRYGVDIDEDTLLIFDEIQLCGEALTSMKYFYEKAPGYSIACAGSLLGVMLSQRSSFPVGKVRFLTMLPMAFPEFLAAMGESSVYERLKDLPVHEPVPEAFVSRMERLYREYCFVGGMPEAVGTWASERDTDLVRKVQSDIVRSYESDLARYAPPGDIQKINRIWASIPEQLAKENRKFIFGHAVEGARAKHLEDALQWLIDAGLIVKVNMISRPSVPLSAYADPSAFKLYYSDIGLLGAAAGIPASSILSEDGRYKEFKGGMAENYVLNEIVAMTGGTPFFWRSGNRAEVDFVHMIKDTVIPIEVKAGPASRVQSMERYIDQYDPGMSFVVSRGDLRITERVTFIPHFLVWNLEHYV